MSQKKLNISPTNKLRVPHVGWDSITIKRKSRLLDRLDPEPRFYFTHSYYLDIQNHDQIVATTDYGVEFVSVFNKDNIYGVQFHPEKSHKHGMALIKNFINLPI